MAVIVKEHSINWGLRNSRATQKNYVDDTSYRKHFATFEQRTENILKSVTARVLRVPLLCAN